MPFKRLWIDGVRGAVHACLRFLKCKALFVFIYDVCKLYEFVIDSFSRREEQYIFNFCNRGRSEFALESQIMWMKTKKY